MRIKSSALQRPPLTLLRANLQRRFASDESTKLVGAMDNAFNRERLAVQQHAAQSAGML